MRTRRTHTPSYSQPNDYSTETTSNCTMDQPLRVYFAPHTHKLLAWLIDWGILSATFYLVHLHWAFWFICTVAYFTLLEYSTLQGSLGEYIIGIQIRHRTGRPADFKHILARNLAYVLTLGLSSFSSLFSRKGRSLHDQIGHTVSIEIPQK